MKFQCGRCGKNYLIDNTDTVDKTLTIPCSRCGNSFCIDENMAFYSASGNSKIICENCGQLVIEKVKACPSCNLVLNEQHEAKRIDNKEYEKVVVQDGKRLLGTVVKRVAKRAVRKSYWRPCLSWYWPGQEEPFGFSALSNMR